jgi:uncharacterized integral membrane protein
MSIHGSDETIPEGTPRSPSEPPPDSVRTKSPTRIGSAWVAVMVAVVLGVCLVDFIVQNTRSVKVEFFGAAGHIPVAVALLAAAVTGALVVLVVGIARTTQLRLSQRRRIRLGEPRGPSSTTGQA